MANRRSLAWLESRIFSPSLMGLLVLFVAIVGAVGSFAGQWPRFAWFPASSFGNAGDWVGGIAGMAAVLSLAHELALERADRSAEGIQRLRGALVSGYELDHQSALEARSRRDEYGFGQYRRLLSDARSWAVGVLQCCTTTEHAVLASAAKEISACQLHLDPHYSYSHAAELIEFLRSQEPAPDKSVSDRELAWASLASIPAQAAICMALLEKLEQFEKYIKGLATESRNYQAFTLKPEQVSRWIEHQGHILDLTAQLPLPEEVTERMNTIPKEGMVPEEVVTIRLGAKALLLYPPALFDRYRDIITQPDFGPRGHEPGIVLRAFPRLNDF